MTKRDLVVKIANLSEDEHGKNDKLTQQEIYYVIQKTLDLIIDALADGQTVELRNFGVFEIKERKQRIGRNPNRPAQVVTIPPRRVVKFKPGKVMKEKVTGDDDGAEPAP